MNLYLKTKDFFNTTEEFELLYDSKLQMLVTHPQPSDLSKYYKSKDYISHSDGRKNLLEKLYQLVKKYNLKHKVKLINSFNPKSKQLLDIGSGTGDFLIEAKNNGWAIEGIEPNRLARTNAAKKGIHLHEKIEGLSKGKFDVITLWHVLEHLPDLQNQIDSISSLLNPQGVLIIAAPNFKSYDAKIYGRFWAAFDVPRHLWHFSRNSIPLLFNSYNLQVTNTRPMYFDSYYVSLLSEKYKTGKNNYLRAIYRGFVSNLKALSTKEYSSIIYILKKA